jgi:serine/threonine protein kinase
VKVLDFGLAKVAGQSRLTKAGLVFGTPHYMSPEQASGGTIDERTDVYTLGIVMYEMFTGRVPFEADTYMGVLTKHLYAEPTPPSVHLGSVAELGALEQVTLRCLEKKPERRFASMSALALELRRIGKFTEDGGFTVELTELREPRGPRLADELELPSSAELSSTLRRLAASERRPGGMVLTALVASTVVAVGAAWTWSFLAHRTLPAASAPLVASARAIVGPVGPSSAPVAPRAAIPNPPDMPSAAVREIPVSTPGRRKARSRSDPRAAPSPSSTKSLINKDKEIGSELVDPWSR